MRLEPEPFIGSWCTSAHDSEPTEVSPRLPRLAAELANFPSKHTLRRLAAQACAAGLQLTFYNSSHEGVKTVPCPGVFCPEVDCRALVGPDWAPVGLSTSGSAGDDDDSCVTTYCTLAPPRWGEHADARHANADVAVLRAMQNESETTRRQAGWYDWGSSRPPALAAPGVPDSLSSLTSSSSTLTSITATLSDVHTENESAITLRKPTGSLPASADGNA